MKKIDKILKYLDNQRIDVAKFERESGISNGYFANTLKREADITDKILDKIRQNQPEIYAAVFAGERQEPLPVVTPLHEQSPDLQAMLIKQLLDMNRQLLESQAKRDQTEAVYAEAHKLLSSTHAEISHVLAGHAVTTKDILSEVKELNVNLNDSNTHFSRITKEQMILLEKMAAKLGVSDLPEMPAEAVSATPQPSYTADSK